MVVAVVVDTVVVTSETGIETFSEIEIETVTFETVAMAPHFDETWIATGIAETGILTTETTAADLVVVAHAPQRATSAT